MPRANSFSSRVASVGHGGTSLQRLLLRREMSGQPELMPPGWSYHTDPQVCFFVDRRARPCVFFARLTAVIARYRVVCLFVFGFSPSPNSLNERLDFTDMQSLCFFDDIFALMFYPNIACSHRVFFPCAIMCHPRNVMIWS